MVTRVSRDSFISQATSDIKEKARKLEQIKESKFSNSLVLPTVTAEVDVSDAEGIIDDLDDAVAKYAQDIARDLAAKLDASLVSYKLVKTGKLRDSLVVDVTRDSVTISYGVPYAALLQYGGYIKPYGNPNAKKVYIAPRPWVDDVFDSYNFEEKFRI